MTAPDLPARRRARVAAPAYVPCHRVEEDLGPVCADELEGVR